MFSGIAAEGGTFTLDSGGSPVTVPLLSVTDNTLSSGAPIGTGGSVAAQLDAGNLMTVDGLAP